MGSANQKSGKALLGTNPQISQKAICRGSNTMYTLWVRNLVLPGIQGKR